MIIRSTHPGVWLALAALAMLGGIGPAVCFAQRGGDRSPSDRPGRERDRPDRPQQRDPQHDRGGDRPQRPPMPPGQRPFDGPRPVMHRVLGEIQFQPEPTDIGPLRPGEERELMDFTRQRAPRLYRIFREVRDRNPPGFGDQMRRAVPRLRQLRRVFEEDERLGHRMVKHLENGFLLKKLEHEYRLGQERPDLRRQVEQRIGDLERQNFELEMDVLGDRLARLERGSAKKAKELADAVLEPEANLFGEPEEIRKLAAEIPTTKDKRERRELEARLRTLCEQRVDTVLSHLRQRYENMRGTAEDEIAHRIRGRLERQATDGPQHAGPDQDRRSQDQP